MLERNFSSSLPNILRKRLRGPVMFVTGVGLGLLVACSGQESPGTMQTSPSGYPLLYTSANLPEYPHVTLVDRGRQTTSLRDGLKLKLESNDPVQTIATFYESEMKNLGWNVPQQKSPTASVYVSYIEGDLYFQITIARAEESGPTSVTINYAQD